MNTLKPHNNLYRIPDDGVIAGVCAGISERFGFAVWSLRVLLVIASLFGILFFPFIYLVAWLLLDKKTIAHSKLEDDSTEWRGANE
ncbi:MAG: PspC domain-containing protein [Psychromonas sp.]|nr:PspC domain-containing protein [Alteromonadales bacterium]MCP5079116.1 PspC domain-containing protein [Psychromonas sp.]